MNTLLVELVVKVSGVVNFGNEYTSTRNSGERKQKESCGDNLRPTSVQSNTISSKAAASITS